MRSPLPDRRTFVRTLAAGAAAAAFPAHARAVRHGPRPGPTHIDCLCYGSDFSPAEVSAALDGGLTAAVFDLPIYPRAPESALETLERLYARFHAPDSRVALVGNAADLAAAQSASRLGIILGCQDASILGAPSADFVAVLKRYHGLGLRLLQLTHNSRTAFGDSYQERRDAGVSRAGERLVGAMNELGVIVDLAHCSRQTLLDAVALSSKPCAVSHAGCRALAPTARNKTDEEIRALGRAGGFFGVFHMTLWLTDRPTATLDTVIDHIDHALQIIGAPQVGFGSDGALVRLDAEVELRGMKEVQQANAGGPSFEWATHHVRLPALNAPDRLTRLAEGLSRRRFSDDAIAGVVGGNFQRFFQQVCG